MIESEFERKQLAFKAYERKKYYVLELTHLSLDELIMVQNSLHVH